jgi:hypothetical protein
LLAFLVVLERMPGKRERNGRCVRREKAAIKMKASRSRCAESNVVAVAEKLAWSRFMAKEDVDLLASEGFDKKLLEKIKNESAACACAFCGVIIFGDSNMHHARDVAEVFSSTALWPRFSARGVAASNFIAPVIREPVSKDGQLFSGMRRHLPGVRKGAWGQGVGGNTSAVLAGLWLPRWPSRTYAGGKSRRRNQPDVRESCENQTQHGRRHPFEPFGHLINFRHSGPDSISKVLPNTDVGQLIVVHFIGGNQKF